MTEPRFVMPPFELVDPEGAAAFAAKEADKEVAAAIGEPTSGEVLAERATVGALLQSVNAVATAIDIVAPEDFADARHAAIARVAYDMYAAGETAIDWLVILDRIRPDELADAAPLDDSYLRTLVATTPTPANVAEYARIVHGRAVGRRIVRAGLQITQVGRSTDEAAKATRAAEILAAATRETVQGSGPQPVGDHLETVMRRIYDGLTSGPSTGLTDLDRLTNGLSEGLWVVGARPGIGKSVLMSDMARSVAIRQGLPALLFTLEMNLTEVLMRILSAESRVPLHLLRTGGDKLTPDDNLRLSRAQDRIAAAPLLVDDTTDLSTTDVAVRTRREHTKRPLAWVGVDYLQLLRPDSKRDNREQEVSASMRSLKVLQGELAINVTLAAQLNRGPEQRTDKRPTAADLRESGSIEANANVIILLHRPDAYDRESERAGEVDLIVAKNRDGALDTITAASQLHLARFVDMAVV